MKVFLSRVDGGVMVQARMEAEGIVGEVAQLVEPGDDFFGYSHDQLVAMGNGEHVLPDA
jgi:hypothetical protein